MRQNQNLKALCDLVLHSGVAPEVEEEEGALQEVTVRISPGIDS